MRLIELLRHVSDWNDDDTTIYLSLPWLSEAKAILVTPAPEDTAPVVRDGISYQYFMETFIAREFVEDYALSDAATEEEQCKRLIQYAQDDA